MDLNKRVIDMLDTKVELLGQVALFRGLSPTQIAAIANVAKKALFDIGDKIVTEGEVGDTAYIIMTGKAACPRIEGDHHFDQDLWPGTLIGELAMLVDTTHNFSVVAKERVRAMALHREDLRVAMEAEPGIAQHISEMLLVRLHGLAADLRRIDNQLAAIENAA